jgi:hypothetical protein
MNEPLGIGGGHKQLSTIVEMGECQYWCTKHWLNKNQFRLKRKQWLTNSKPLGAYGHKEFSTIIEKGGCLVSMWIKASNKKSRWSRNQRWNNDT